MSVSPHIVDRGGVAKSWGEGQKEGGGRQREGRKREGEGWENSV